MHRSHAQPDRRCARGCASLHALAELSGSAIEGELSLLALDPRSATPDPRGHLPEALERHLTQTGAWAELAVVAQELGAHATGASRAGLLVQAARAYEQLPDGAGRALERLCDALVLDPPRGTTRSLRWPAPRRGRPLVPMRSSARCAFVPEPEALRTLAAAERSQLGCSSSGGAQPSRCSEPPRALGCSPCAKRSRATASRGEAELVAEHGATSDAHAGQLERALRDAPKAQRSEPACAWPACTHGTGAGATAAG